MNKLITTNNEIRMSSKELCDLINMFRAEEGNSTEKRHDVLLRDIDNEIKTLQNVGIPTFHNFVESSYKEGNRNYRCYSLTKKGAMQILNKESAKRNPGYVES